MSNKVVVISGKQFSGKDTVANLVTQFMPDFYRIGLADALKKEFAADRGISLEEIEKNKSVYRPDLIAHGDKRRSEDADYWIKQVIAAEGNKVISDLRLKHELDVFREYGAITVRVEASRDVRAQRGVLVKEDDPTEVELDNIIDWDYVVKNDLDYKTLTENVRKLTEELKKNL